MKVKFTCKGKLVIAEICRNAWCQQPIKASISTYVQIHKHISSNCFSCDGDFHLLFILTTAAVFTVIIVRFTPVNTFSIESRVF